MYFLVADGKPLAYTSDLEYGLSLARACSLRLATGRITVLARSDKGWLETFQEESMVIDFTLDS